MFMTSCKVLWESGDLADENNFYYMQPSRNRFLSFYLLDIYLSLSQIKLVLELVWLIIIQKKVIAISGAIAYWRVMKNLDLVMQFSLFNVIDINDPNLFGTEV